MAVFCLSLSSFCRIVSNFLILFSFDFATATTPLALCKVIGAMRGTSCPRPEFPTLVTMLRFGVFFSLSLLQFPCFQMYALNSGRSTSHRVFFIRWHIFYCWKSGAVAVYNRTSYLREHDTRFHVKNGADTVCLFHIFVFFWLPFESAGRSWNVMSA